MTAGTWCYVTTKDHPHSYDAAVGKVGDNERFNIGAIIFATDGDSAKRPGDPAGHAYEAMFYRWVFFAGLTVEDLIAKMPEAARDNPDEFKGALRLINDQKSSVRTRADFDTDVRLADKRTVMDRLKGR